MKLENETVLYTGACSGIGKLMAEIALKRNIAKLIIIDIIEDGLAATSKEFAHYNIPIFTYLADLSSMEQIKLTAEKILAEVGTVDILINNACIVKGAFFHEHTHEDIDKSMRINADAPMHLTLSLLPSMVKNNSGAICTIASSAGLISNPKMTVYVASQWAATGWTHSLRLEMNKLNKNISVTTIMPFLFLPVCSMV